MNRLRVSKLKNEHVVSALLITFLLPFPFAAEDQTGGER